MLCFYKCDPWVWIDLFKCQYNIEIEIEIE